MSEYHDAMIELVEQHRALLPAEACRALDDARASGQKLPIRWLQEAMGFVRRAQQPQAPAATIVTPTPHQAQQPTASAAPTTAEIEDGWSRAFARFHPPQAPQAPAGSPRPGAQSHAAIEDGWDKAFARVGGAR